MKFVTVTKHLTLLAAAMVLFGCSAGGSAGSGQVNRAEVETGTATLIAAQPDLSWEVCEINPLLECATLLVPMNYADPTARTIDVALARIKVDRTTSRRTVLLNPGGPGGSGIDFLSGLTGSGTYSQSIADTFSFVSFDPRGLGQSTPLDCDMTEYFLQDIYATSREEIAFNFDKSNNFAQACLAKTGEYLQHVGSLNVVRDINEMRKALGLTQIDFIGYSYGTRLAALYMQLYPESTGRFVLDGSMTPDPSIVPLARGSLLPGQANIDSLAGACILGRSVICNSADFAVQLQERVDILAAQEDSQEASLLFTILLFASTQPGFENLLIGRLATYLETEDVAELEFLVNFLGLSEAEESESGFSRSAFVAVMCADDANRPTVDSIDALRAPFNEDSNLLAESYIGVAAMCAAWPEAVDPIPQIATNQAPVSLVIGGPTDAQTPLVFAEQMAAAVGGQFLHSEHSGHTTVFTGKNRCTDTVVEKFLLSGTLPSVSVCRAIRSAVVSDWQDDFTRMPY